MNYYVDLQALLLGLIKTLRTQLPNSQIIRGNFSILSENWNGIREIEEMSFLSQSRKKIRLTIEFHTTHRDYNYSSSR